jgi:hypothetical protein
MMVYFSHLIECTSCDHSQETQIHCLWEYITANQIWGRIILFIQLNNLTIISWGQSLWLSLSQEAFTYEMLDYNIQVYCK